MRPIDGEKLEEILEKWLKECEFSEPDGNVEAQAVYACICELHNMPTLDVAPVVHGKWVFADDGYLRCSECTQKAPVVQPYDDEPTTTATNYCPNFGAIMDLED